METTNIPSYYDLCRLCTASDGQKVYLYGTEGQRRQLSQKIQACLPVRIGENDALPKMVCHQCAYQVENFCTFRENCVKAESTLMGYFRKSQNGDAKEPVRWDTQYKGSEAAITPDTVAVTSQKHATDPSQNTSVKIEANNMDTLAQEDFHMKHEIQTECQYSELMGDEGVVHDKYVTTDITHIEFPSKTEYSESSQPDGNQETSRVPAESQVVPSPSPLANAYPVPQSAFTLNNGQITVTLNNENRQLEFSSFDSPNNPCNQDFESSLMHVENGSRYGSSESIPKSHVGGIQDDGSNSSTSVDMLSAGDGRNSGHDGVIGNVDEGSFPSMLEQPDSTRSHAIDGMTNHCSQDFGNAEDWQLHCEVCGTVFQNSIEFILHTADHYGEAELFTCGVCQKQFQGKDLLDRHMVMHLSNRQFGCNFCGKFFAKKYCLKQHYLIHNFEKPHACNVCGKGFKRKDHLAKHKEIHNTVKCYTCGFCGKPFSVKYYLLRHQKLHTKI